MKKKGKRKKGKEREKRESLSLLIGKFIVLLFIIAVCM